MKNATAKKATVTKITKAPKPTQIKMTDARPTEPGNYLFRANPNYINAGGVKLVLVEKTRFGVQVDSVDVNSMRGQFSVKPIEVLR